MMMIILVLALVFWLVVLGMLLGVLLSFQELSDILDRAAFFTSIYPPKSKHNSVSAKLDAGHKQV